MWKGASMKITSIETIHLARGITVHAGPVQWLLALIHTDELAPVPLGRDPLSIDRLWADT